MLQDATSRVSYIYSSCPLCQHIRALIGDCSCQCSFQTRWVVKICMCGSSKTSACTLFHLVASSVLNPPTRFPTGCNLITLHTQRPQQLDQKMMLCTATCYFHIMNLCPYCLTAMCNTGFNHTPTEQTRHSRPNTALDALHATHCRPSTAWPHAPMHPDLVSPKSSPALMQALVMVTKGQYIRPGTTVSPLGRATFLIYPCQHH